MNLGLALSKLARRPGLVLMKHSPTIMTISGVVCIVGGGVLACVKTYKGLDDVVDRHLNKLLKIEDNIDRASQDGAVPYPTKDVRKDKLTTYAQTSWDYIKLYGPSVLLVGVGVASVFGGHRILNKRNISLMAAVKTVEEAYNAYRHRVVDEYGVDKDFQFYSGMKEEQITVEQIDPVTGKKKKIKETILTPIDGKSGSIYSTHFGPGCPQWDANPSYNLMFLKGQQNYFNDLLGSRGHVFLSEVYDVLGIERTKESVVVGWLRGDEHGDGYVDFGLGKFAMSRLEPDWSSEEYFAIATTGMHLDFNVDGPIWDKI